MGGTTQVAWTGRRWQCAAVAVSLAAGGAGMLRADPFDIVLSEIHYNPADGPRSEFIEIHHAGTRPESLAGWRLAGGISFTFPEVVIYPGEHLAVALDAEFLRGRAGLPAGDRRVVGNFTGRLSDGGEQLVLRTAQGLTVFQMTYDEDDPWPEEADGRGPSLERRSFLDDHDLPGSWTRSRTIGGTPARANSTALVVRRRGIVAEGEVWRFRKGTSEPGGGAGWTTEGYDDSGWLEGPLGIGHGDGDDATVLTDLPGGYSTVYLRKTFTLPSAPAGRLRLSVAYQDGFAAFLNGREVARRGLGDSGTGPVPFDALASAPRTEPAAEVFDLSSAAPWLSADGNVLSVQVANDLLADGSVSFSAELFAVEEEAAASGVELPLRINEVRGGADGFVELFNASGGPVALDGLALLELSAGRQAPAPAGSLAGGGRLVVPASAFQGPPLAEAASGVMALVAPAEPPGAPIHIDLLAFRLPADPAPGRSFGRVPDGGEEAYVLEAPSPLARNRVSLRTDIVINEIHYHPALEGGKSPPLEFIEIHNRGASAADLTGFKFTRGIPFSGFDGVTIARGGYLVIAPDPQAVEARYGLSGVLGGFDGGLKNDAEVIRLEDPLGNPASRVRYADDGAWPSEADAGGRSLELRSPSLESRLGLAWAASAASGGTPGRANSVLEADPGPALGELDHRPLVPGSRDPVVVTAAASDNLPGLAVTLRHRRESDGSFASAPMRDDGQGDDALAGDGVFSARIPPQPADSIVLFYVEATDARGQRAVFPRPAPSSTPLYAVRDDPEGGVLPRFRLVMTRADRRELESRPATSDVFLDCTLIYGDRAHYHGGVRYRGRGSRTYPVKSYRIELAHDDPLEGITDLVLNGRNLHHQRMGMDFFRRAGLPYSRSQIVNLSLNESDLGLRIRMEHVDDEYIAYHFPGREGGNIYRGEMDATLEHLGANPSSYSSAYLKENNYEDATYADVIELCDAFENSSGPEFPGRIAGLIDEREWLLFFACHDVLSNLEGGIWRDTGDDYFLYRAPATAALPQEWFLLPWDFDDIFEDPLQRVPRTTVPSILRLLRDPVLAGPAYFCDVRSVAAGPFAPRVMNARIGTLTDLFPDPIDDMQDFVARRSSYLERALGYELTAEVRPGELLPPEGEWRFWKGSAPPPGAAGDWTRPGYDDSAWNLGAAGFGYGDGDDRTLLEDMQGRYTTVFIRRTFRVADPQGVGALALMVDYDDGFVAYLNGEEVARDNYDGPGVVAHTALAGGSHEAGTAVRFDLASRRDLLRAGDNVLALVGLNNLISSGDLSLSPWLVTQPGGTWGCGEALFTGAAAGILTGTLPLCRIALVTVNGAPAGLNPSLGTWSISAEFRAPESVFEVESFGPAGEPLDRMQVRVRRAGAGSQVPGSIPADALWSAAGSPYVLGGDTTVAAGATLTIEAGASVLLAPQATLVVRGRLLVEGRAEAPVRFARASCAGPWGGLAVLGAGAQARIRHAVLERSGAASDGASVRGGVLASVDGNLTVEDSSFAANGATAVSIVGGTATVAGNRFAGGPGGVRVEGARAEIAANEIDSTAGDADAIVVVGGAAGEGAVEGNRIAAAGRNGIVLDGSSFPVRENRIAGALSRGIRLQNASSARVERNVVYFCDTGISISAASTPVLDHLTVAYNSTAIEAARGILVENSILWENFRLAGGAAPAAVAVEYSEVSPRDLPPGPGNIDGDPLFADILAGDFHLLRGSPAIGAARDGSDLGAIPYDGSRFIRGDAGGDGRVGLPDAVATLEALFRGGYLDCESAADANDDGAVDISDPLRLLLFLYAGGPPIPAPFPACAADPTPDPLPDCTRGCN